MKLKNKQKAGKIDGKSRGSAEFGVCMQNPFKKWNLLQKVNLKKVVRNPEEIWETLKMERKWENEHKSVRKSEKSEENVHKSARNLWKEPEMML